MSATDLAAIVVTALSLVMVAVMVIAVQSMVRTLRELRLTVDELRGSTLPMVEDLRSTVAKAGDGLERVDGIIDRAESITTTVDNASRLTYKAMAPPLIKTISLIAGAGRATRRIRWGRSGRVIEARATPTHRLEQTR